MEVEKSSVMKQNSSKILKLSKERIALHARERSIPRVFSKHTTALSQTKQVFFASVTLSLPKHHLLKVPAPFPGESYVSK